MTSVAGRAEERMVSGAADRARRGRVAGLALLLVVALALPFLLSGFRLFQLTQVFIYAMALMGLNMLTGYNGQISLGHGAFYAVGAYTAAIMIDRWNIPYGLTVVAAAAICLVAGFLFGIPALRLEGLYLALATFALALAVPQILKYFEHWTGGSQGIVLTKPEAPFELVLTASARRFLAILGLIALLGLVVSLLRGRTGRPLVAGRAALAALAAVLVLPQALAYVAYSAGGPAGLMPSAAEGTLRLKLTPDQWLYYFSLGVLIALIVLAWNLLRGRTGRAIVAIRDHPLAAEAMGINSALYKSLVFGVSAAYTGVAGALSAIVIAFVAPDAFNVFLSITFLVGIVIGGLASISGAIWGALFVQFVPNWAQDLSKAAPWAIYGIFLIAFMYVMPRGIAGFVRLAWARLRRRRAELPRRGAS